MFSVVRGPLTKFLTPLQSVTGTQRLTMATQENHHRMMPKYHGTVQACVFDWAGTICDSGVFAPVLSFQKLFENEGVPITDEEARGPMGVHKRTHIEKVLEHPSVRQRWASKKGGSHTEKDIDRIYGKYLTTTMDVLANNSKLITGTVETIEVLRSKYGIKIGSSTGYTKEIMEKLKPMAAKEGYAPDCYVTSDEVPVARPSPSLIFLNMIRMDIWTAKAVVKVDDTVGGIVAGHHAGCWTVGIAKTGNYVGATEDQLAKMDPQELEGKVKSARAKLYQSGAHFVIDTISDLPPVIDEINARLALGLSP